MKFKVTMMLEWAAPHPTYTYLPLILKPMYTALQFLILKTVIPPTT